MSCLATFKTTSAALMFERTCRSSGISARIAPVPRSLSSSCGLACEFPCDLRDKVEEIATSKKISVAGYHSILE
ncbi:MAG: DUF3343 domain-containing protein [Synergistaceae bacterium]|nr:DUF3343 domain-containing protein [Synergistaceae bacterium]MBR0094998.1 DUF3343 domain-containing protein [Synergistaceae bacterium]